MKLYTEEQVKESLMKHQDSSMFLSVDQIDYLISEITPIELPSDEEIGEESPYIPNDASLDFWAHKEGFVDGAKWMRDKIGGKDEQ